MNTIFNHCKQIYDSKNFSLKEKIDETHQQSRRRALSALICYGIEAIVLKNLSQYAVAAAASSPVLVTMTAVSTIALALPYFRSAGKLAEFLSLNMEKAPLPLNYRIYDQIPEFLFYLTGIISSIALLSLGIISTPLWTLSFLIANRLMCQKFAYPRASKVLKISFKSDTKEKIAEKLDKLQPVTPQQKVEIDLSFSEITDHTLPLLMQKVLGQSKQIENVLLKLTGCQKITEEGIDQFLKAYPTIRIDLTDTSFDSDTIYSLQSQHIHATLDYHTISQDMENLFLKQIASDLIFTVGGEMVHSHRFIFTAFGEHIPLVTGPIEVEGISKEKFLEILKRVYQGRISSDLCKEMKEVRLKNQPQIFSKPYPQHFLNYLFLSGKGSDIVINTPEGSFKAHKAILMARSEHFKMMLQSSMKESQGTIVFNQYSQEEMKAILQFIYTGDLPPETHYNPQTLLGKVGTLDSIDLYRLLQCRWLKTTSNLNENTVLSFCLEAEESNLWIMREACQKFLKTHFGLSLAFKEGVIHSVTILNSSRPFNLILSQLPALQKIYINEVPRKEYLEDEDAFFEKLTLGLQANSITPQLYIKKAINADVLKKFLNFKIISYKLDYRSIVPLEDLIVKREHLRSLKWESNDLFNLDQLALFTKLHHLEVALCFKDGSEALSENQKILRSNAVLQTIACHMPKLRSLKIRNLLFGDLSKLSQLTHLKELSLTGCKIHMEGLRALFDANRNLERVDFNTMVDDPTIISLAMKELNLSKLSFDFYSSVPNASVDALATYSKKLTSLTIRGHENLPNSKSIQNVLKSCPFLRHLSFVDDFRLNTLDFFIIFEKPTALTSLKLDAKNVLESTLNFILNQCPYLEKLQLRSCSALSEKYLESLSKHYPNLKVFSY